VVVVVVAMAMVVVVVWWCGDGGGDLQFPMCGGSFLWWCGGVVTAAVIFPSHDLSFSTSEQLPIECWRT
jgi:hypothetical protein